MKEYNRTKDTIECMFYTMKLFLKIYVSAYLLFKIPSIINWCMNVFNKIVEFGL